eukprot:GHVH01003731.1.p1 GENE.GHVH01003731.1~~GHVH01003731.1.p1  ORF type:complete len:909 (+),score=150.85 GHVH01003731.1:90-2816(+)
MAVYDYKKQKKWKLKKAVKEGCEDENIDGTDQDSCRSTTTASSAHAEEGDASEGEEGDAKDASKGEEGDAKDASKGEEGDAKDASEGEEGDAEDASEGEEGDAKDASEGIRLFPRLTGYDKMRYGLSKVPSISYKDASAEGNQKLAELYNLAFMDSDSDVDSDETMFNRNRSGLSDRAIEHFYQGHSMVGYTALGTQVKRLLNDSVLGGLLKKDNGESKDLWKTVTDFANQKKIVLSPEDIETIRRISVGQFPGVNYDAFSADNSVVDFDYATPDLPVNDNVPRARFQRMRKFTDRKINKIVRSMANGTYVSPEERLRNHQEQKQQDLNLMFDIWNSDIPLQKRHMPMIHAPKEPLPSHKDSYRPPQELLNEDAEWPTALRRVEQYLPLVEDRMNRLLDLSHCERSYKMQLNIDRESLLPPLPPLKSLRPFPTDLKLQLKGLTMWRLKGEEGDNKKHYTRVMKSKAGCSALNISPCGHFMAVGDSQGVVSVVHYINPMLPGVVVWRDTLHIADDNDTGLATKISALRFHPSAPILAICKGLFVVYVIIPEMRGTSPRKLRIPSGQVSAMSEREVIEAYWELYEGDDNVRKSMQRLGLCPEGGPAIVAQELEGAKSYRVRFSVTMKRLVLENKELDEMGDEEQEMVERAGEAVELKDLESGETKNEMYLRSRPGLSVIGRHKSSKITNGNWDSRGNYFAVCSASSRNAKDAVIVHNVPTWQSIHVTSMKLNHVHSVAFHPSQPLLYCGHFQGAVVLNLHGGPSKNEVVKFKKLRHGGGAVSMDTHVNGNVCLLGNTKEQLLMYDLESGSKPVHRLDLLAGAIRSVSFHPVRPLAACVVKSVPLEGPTTSQIHLFHVATPEFSDAFAIPVKILNLEGKGEALGQLSTCQWHPREPWLLTGHSDGSVCSWH